MPRGRHGDRKRKRREALVQHRGAIRGRLAELKRRLLPGGGD